jgi:hypothetical protein
VWLAAWRRRSDLYIEEKTEWGGALATLALNALTLPLGIAVGARPGKSTTAQVARCCLVLCQACGRRHRGFFSGLKLSEVDCARHPSWGRLQNEGFDRFLDHAALDRFR